MLGEIVSISLRPVVNRRQQRDGGSSRVKANSAMALIGQLAHGAGIGRYLGGLAPDVSISADGTIHPIPDSITRSRRRGRSRRNDSVEAELLSLSAREERIHEDH